jgi:hypothetical protein
MTRDITSGGGIKAPFSLFFFFGREKLLSFVGVGVLFLIFLI